MTETPNVTVAAEPVELVPDPPKKHVFNKKLVIALATATAAVLVGGYLWSKTSSDEENEESPFEDNMTEEVMEETHKL